MPDVYAVCGNNCRYLVYTREQVLALLEQAIADGSLRNIDIDAAEINKNINVKVGVNCDVKSAIAQINEIIEKQTRPEWWEKLSSYREKENQYTGDRFGSLTPYGVIDAVNKIKNDDTDCYRRRSASDVGGSTFRF